jgi:DNA-binding transcriptional MerR regulator
MDLLNHYRNESFKGVAELASAVADVLGSIALQQSRRMVSDVPNERTIRYYLAEGLLPPADRTEGTASIFSFRHLLTLVAIKHLQAREIPIRTIKRILTGLDLSGLERLLSDEVRVSFDPRDADSARERGEDVIAIDDHQEIRELLSQPRTEFAGDRLSLTQPAPAPSRAKVAQTLAPPLPHKALAREPPPDRRAPVTASSAEPVQASAAEMEPRSESDRAERSQTWERFSVEQGIELQISPDAGLDEPSKRKFMDAIKDLLSHFRHSLF